MAELRRDGDQQACHRPLQQRTAQAFPGTGEPPISIALLLKMPSAVDHDVLTAGLYGNALRPHLVTRFVPALMCTADRLR